LLSSSPHALFNNEVLVTLLHAHKTSILSSHHFSSDNIGSHVLGVVRSTTFGIEITDVFLGFFSFLHFFHLGIDLSLNFLFSSLVFTANTADSSSGVFAGSVLLVVGVEQLLVSFSIDSVYGIVETLALSVDRVFKIQVLLGDVLTDDSSIVQID
jgi:hypothetical protein